MRSRPVLADVRALPGWSLPACGRVRARGVEGGKLPPRYPTRLRRSTTRCQSRGLLETPGRVTIENDADEVLIKSTASDVEKFVNKLIAETAEKHEAELVRE